LRVVDGDQRGAVASGRDADDGAARATRDRAVVAVDVGDQIVLGGGLPVAARAPVVPLGGGVAGAGALGAAPEGRVVGGRQPSRVPGDALVGLGAGGQAMQDVEDRVALPARGV